MYWIVEESGSAKGNSVRYTICSSIVEFNSIIDNSSYDFADGYGPFTQEEAREFFQNVGLPIV